jgi:toxin ParE1/3/4
MVYEVALTKDAERDLEDTDRYIAEHDSPASADQVLEHLLQTTDSLRSSPDRGAFPKELRSLGIAEYRQVFFEPYRLIYRVHTQRVVVYLNTDCRRDMQSLFARRLLGT